MTVDSTLDTVALDVAVADLRAGQPSWAALPLAEKIALLDGLRPKILAEAESMVAEAARHKGLPISSPWSAEDWAGVPWALLQGVRTLLLTLRRVEAGEPPIALSRTRTEGDGRTVVEVFPATLDDKLLLSGYSAQVWMRDGVSREQAVASAASMYRGKGYPHAGVSLVLGAGNVGSIAPLDVLHVLYAEGCVVIVKMNPVNDYLSPYFARIFSDFIERGWLRFAHGGGEVGGYLAQHAGVDAVHMTGSAATHDAIVWGTGAEAAERRAAGTPLLTKRITSELGGVSPLIVTPGPWTDADLQYQAEHIVSSKVNNAGHNCIATQVLVLPASWDRSDELLDRIRAVLRSLPPRKAYYPGSEAKVARAIDAQDAETFGDTCVLVPVLDPRGTESLLTDEVFAGVFGVVRLPGASAAEFLANAVAFSNEVLPGTLGATLLVDPATEKNEPAVRRAISDLRFGTLGVNVWSGMGFLLGYVPWGAFPGDTLDTIGSGIGSVHNSFLLEGVEKSVVRMPFRPMHRAALKGHFHLSPKSPALVTNKTAALTMKRLCTYLATDKVTALPSIFASALRG
jgi:acyl-CoA reductase-like NAD-dependent aldehyde dehydrogenase